MSEEALNQEAEDQIDIEEGLESDDIITDESIDEPGELEEEEEGETLSSFSQLADHLEVEPDFLLGLKVGTKVDGQPAETTIQDLVNSYQTQEAATHRLEDAKEKAKTLIQEANAERDQIKTELGTAAGMVMLAEQLFGKELSDADLANLRETDREAYLIEKDRLTERRTAIDQMKSEIGQQLQAYMSPVIDQETIDTEKAALVKTLPHLEPVEARTQLAEYILTQGFSREDLKTTADHRLFVLAEKARQFDELKSKTDAAKNKVVTIPKLMKPGASQGKVEEPKDAADILYD